MKLTIWQSHPQISRLVCVEFPAIDIVPGGILSRRSPSQFRSFHSSESIRFLALLFHDFPTQLSFFSQLVLATSSRLISRLINSACFNSPFSYFAVSHLRETYFPAIVMWESRPWAKVSIQQVGRGRWRLQGLWVHLGESVLVVELIGQREFRMEVKIAPPLSPSVFHLLIMILGGLQAGSDLFGLGGGYTITNTSMEIGAGMGFTQLNASASLNFVGYSNGTFEMEFSSSTPFECTQETKDGLQTMRCSYV